MRLRRLADLCVSSKSRLTHAIDRAEERGWIERAVAEEDGRGIVAHLLPAGRQALADASPVHAGLIERHLLAHWSEDDRRVIADASARAAEAMRGRRVSLPPSDPPG